MSYQRGNYDVPGTPPGYQQPIALDTNVVGLRVLATIIDAVVLGIAGLILGVIFGIVIAVTASTRSSAPQVIVTLLLVVIILALSLAYYIVLEGYRGQTVGKMLVGIRVVREDTGGVPGYGAATVRTLMRIVDGLFGNAVALIAALSSQKHQRLGDMVAHTLVVRR